MKLTSVALTAILLLATPAMADVVKIVRTEYYAVNGTSPKIIYANLKRGSPLNEGTETYQAHTRTNIRYKFKWRKRGKECSIQDFTVFLDLTYMYPRLARSVDNKTRKWWKEFLINLEIHENIHGDISIKAAHELDDAMKKFTSNDCLNFKDIVKNRANWILQKMKKAQIEYDRLTEHGLKQDRNMGRYP